MLRELQVSDSVTLKNLIGNLKKFNGSEAVVLFIGESKDCPIRIGTGKFIRAKSPEYGGGYEYEFSVNPENIGGFDFKFRGKEFEED